MNPTTINLSKINDSFKFMFMKYYQIKLGLSTVYVSL